MTPEQARAKLDELRSPASEHECVEFKQAKSNLDSDQLGRYVSALANEVALAGLRHAWLVFGVHDREREPGTDRRIVVGTSFATGAEALNTVKKAIADNTTGGLTFRVIHDVAVDGKRVLVFEIPPAPVGQPVAWKGHYYGRHGSSLGALSLDEVDRLRGKASDWSAEVVDGASFDDLDPAAIARARTNYGEKFPKQREQLASWDDKTFLNKARITTRGQITRTALLLLGTAEASQLLAGADPRITWVLKHSDGSNRDAEHFFPPFLLATSAVASRVRNTNYQFMRDATLFPDNVIQYDDWVLRELLHNCVAHQDYGLGGRIILVEHEDTLEFVNPGRFVAGTVEDRLIADAGLC